MLTAHSLKERLIKGGIWAVAGRVVGLATGLAVNALLARLLTPEDMGAYFLTISLVSVAALIAQLGLPTAVVRLVAESTGKGNGGRARAVVKISIGICASLTLMIAMVFYFGLGQWVARSVFESTSMEKVIGIATLLIVVTALQGLVAEIFRGFHDIRFATLFGGVITSLFSSIAFGLIWLLQGHAELKEVLQLSLGVWVLSFLIAIFLLPSKFSSLHSDGDIDAKEVLKVSLPMGVISFTVYVATQGDLWVVGAFLSDQQVAVYGAVLRLVMVMTMAHSLVVSIVQSTIAELHAQEDKVRIEQLVQGAAFAACVPAMLLLVGYATYGDNLLAMLFGDFYQVGYYPLMIICAGQFVGMLFGVSGIVLMMSGCQFALMKLIFLVSLFALILAAFLVQTYGMLGVALAWGIGSILQGVGAWFLAKKLLGIRCHMSLSAVNALRGIV